MAVKISADEAAGLIQDGDVVVSLQTAGKFSK